MLSVVLTIPDFPARVPQDTEEEHTVYTMRIRTGYGRGCGLDVPVAGVQVIHTRQLSPTTKRLICACQTCTSS